MALLTSKGSSYLFMLTATNFLGQQSDVLYKMVNRSALPIPTVSVLAPEPETEPKPKPKPEPKPQP